MQQHNNDIQIKMLIAIQYSLIHSVLYRFKIWYSSHISHLQCIFCVARLIMMTFKIKLSLLCLLSIFKSITLKYINTAIIKSKEKNNMICTYLPNLNKFKNCAKKNQFFVSTSLMCSPRKHFIKRVKQIWNRVSKKVLLILEIRRRQ